jgi:hypothetical protein
VVLIKVTLFATVYLGVKGYERPILSAHGSAPGTMIGKNKPASGGKERDNCYTDSGIFEQRQKPDVIGICLEAFGFYFDVGSWTLSVGSYFSAFSVRTTIFQLLVFSARFLICDTITLVFSNSCSSF